MGWRAVERARSEASGSESGEARRRRSGGDKNHQDFTFIYSFYLQAGSRDARSEPPRWRMGRGPGPTAGPRLGSNLGAPANSCGASEPADGGILVAGGARGGPGRGGQTRARADVTQRRRCPRFPPGRWPPKGSLRLRWAPPQPGEPSSVPGRPPESAPLRRRGRAPAAWAAGAVGSSESLRLPCSTNRIRGLGFWQGRQGRRGTGVAGPGGAEKLGAPGTATPAFLQPPCAGGCKKVGGAGSSCKQLEGNLKGVEPTISVVMCSLQYQTQILC